MCCVCCMCCMYYVYYLYCVCYVWPLTLLSCLNSFHLSLVDMLIPDVLPFCGMATVTAEGTLLELKWRPSLLASQDRQNSIRRTVLVPCLVGRPCQGMPRRFIWPSLCVCVCVCAIHWMYNNSVCVCVCAVHCDVQ